MLIVSTRPRPLRDHLAAAGVVQTGIHDPNSIHCSLLRDAGAGKGTPQCRHLAKRILVLPMSLS